MIRTGFDVGSVFHGFHGFEIEPGREEPFAGEGGGALLFCSVALAELLHLVAALRGGLRRDDIRAAGGYFFGHRVPIGGAEEGAVEGVPSLTVGFDQDQCLIARPARRWKLPYRLLSGSGGDRHGSYFR